MSMITDRIGRHKVLLPVNHNLNKIVEKRLFFKSKHKKFQFFFGSSEKESHLRACVMERTVQLLRHDAYCPIKLSY